MKHKRLNKGRTAEQSSRSQPIAIYTDGAGARPDGKGSAIAWVRKDTNESHVEMVDGLTNNQAEYRSILSALQTVPERSVVEIRSDSQVAVYQLSGVYGINIPALADLRDLINTVLTKRKLTATFTWIPRAQNHADKLLQRQKTKSSISASKAESLVEQRNKTRK
jgi:ribonuclease HI